METSTKKQTQNKNFLIRQNEKCKENGNNNGTIYNLFYVRTGHLKEVSRDRFSAMKGPVHVFKNHKLRVIGECKRAIIEKNFNYLNAQGLTDITSGVGALFSSVLGSINLIKDKLGKINKRFVLLLSKLVLELIGFADLVHGKRIDQLINILLSIYSLVDHFSAQGLETWIVAGLSTYLPDALKEVIKTATLFSNTKFFDDFTLVHTLFTQLERFLIFVCETIKVPEKVSSFVRRCFDYLQVGQKHIILSKIERVMELAHKNEKNFMQPGFRETALQLNNEVQNCAGLQDWIQRAGSVKNIIIKWQNFIKIVNSYQSTSRVEPNLFVFDGPPGLFKSVFMTKTIEALGWSAYSHIVPSIDSGKDFYDSYNNEEIFYMDDVGQEGPSQWRSIMNMHSCVKMPLPCADAKLKDTKFFNSHTIFATTNRFINLQGLSKSDCIDNVEALWRRGFVFDFKCVSRVGSKLSGIIYFKHFNLLSKSFEIAFPSYFNYTIKPSFTFNADLDFSTNITNAVTWIGAIVTGFKMQKEKMNVDQRLSPSQIQDIQEKISELIESPEFQDVNDTFHQPPIQKIESLQQSSPNQQPEVPRNFLEGQGLVTTIKTGFSKMLASQFVLDLLMCEFTECANWILEIMSNFSAGQFSHLQGIYIAVGLVIGVISVYLFVTKVSVPKESSIVLEGQGDFFSTDTTGHHNSLEKIRKGVFEIDLLDEDGVLAKAHALVSERLLLIPSHLAPKNVMTVKIYQCRSLNHILVDYTQINVVYRRDAVDLAVFSLPKHFPTPFKSLSHWFKTDNNTLPKQTYLISGKGFITINNLSKLGIVVPYHFKFGKHHSTHYTNDHFLKYDVQALGLCGAVIFSPQSGLLGFHVAGDAKSNIGVASYWNLEDRTVLYNLLTENKPLIQIQEDISDKIFPQSSIVKLDTNQYHAISPSKTNIGISPLFGIYPVDRSPADLQKFGSKTLKTVAKKSFSPCVLIPSKELDFCKLVLDSMIAPFGVLTDEEVVRGTNLLAPLNKDSSNGFDYGKEKTDYINFELGQITPLFSSDIQQFLQSINSGVNYKKLIWTECLKDELRNDEKEGVPRSFRVGTLLQQFLVKKFFGRMVEHIISNRKQNKIMVGCNPVTDWPWMYKHITAGKPFAGDVKNWDGSMNSQLQQLVVESFISKSLESDKNLLAVLCSTLTNSLVVVNNELFMTTHSMPSGSYLTAIMNSIVNKLYTAIWYFRNVENPTLDGFWTDVDDFVYGDDKLNVVYRNFDTLNAITMKQCFESLGMGFTDSLKKPIQTPFQEVSELTFLKRSFVYHNLLQRIVCPLETRVIFNTLSYVDFTKESVDLVMRDKIHAVQRELFLHEDRDFLLEDLYRRLSARNYPYTKLSKEYLLSVYSDSNFLIPYNFYTTSFKYL